MPKADRARCHTAIVLPDTFSGRLPGQSPGGCLRPSVALHTSSVQVRVAWQGDSTYPDIKFNHLGHIQQVLIFTCLSYIYLKIDALRHTLSTPLVTARSPLLCPLPSSINYFFPSFNPYFSSSLSFILKCCKLFLLVLANTDNITSRLWASA